MYELVVFSRSLAVFIATEISRLKLDVIFINKWAIIALNFNVLCIKTMQV